MQYKLGELFCGPGGIAWGATHANIGNSDFSIIHEWANDYDANTCETYRHNICPNEPQTVYHEDIRKLDMNKLTPIDALAFGFPCNDYSVVGEQKGMDGVYGPLYSYGVKALKKFQPQWFLAENVGGLRNANDGKAFSKILAEMLVIQLLHIYINLRNTAYHKQDIVLLLSEFEMILRFLSMFHHPLLIVILIILVKTQLKIHQFLMMHQITKLQNNQKLLLNVLNILNLGKMLLQLIFHPNYN